MKILKFHLTEIPSQSSLELLRFDNSKNNRIKNGLDPVCPGSAAVGTVAALKNGPESTGTPGYSITRCLTFIKPSLCSRGINQPASLPPGAAVPERGQR